MSEPLATIFSNYQNTEYAIASAYALMGNRADALKWLQRTVDDGFPCYPMFERDPNSTI